MKNCTNIDQLFVGKAKHETYEKCKDIYKKWKDQGVDPKRLYDCIEKNIFFAYPVPNSQTVLGFFYIAYLMVAKNIPDMAKLRQNQIPTIVFTSTGPSAPASERESLEKLVRELMEKVDYLEKHQKHAQNHHKEIWQGPDFKN